MKTPFTSTKVAVKVRKSETVPNTWSVYLECYPVFEDGRALRKRFAINRIVTTVVFDKKSTSCTKQKDGTVSHRPKRDFNGVIVCKSDIDKETMLFADKLRCMKQAEYDRRIYASDADKKLMDLQNKQKRVFIEYFDELCITRNKNASNSILINWQCTSRYLKNFLGNKIVTMGNITDQWCRDFREFMIGAPSFAKNVEFLSSASASTYYSIFKAALRQAFVDGYFSEDIASRLKNIPVRNAQRLYLSIEELNKLIDTPCDRPVMKRAAIFSALTGIRHVDIKNMKWRDIMVNDGQYNVNFTQKKTGEVNYLPISEQAYLICGTPGSPGDYIFEDLPNPSWISRPLKRWIKSAGITRNITFHSFRHTFATLQIESGTNLYIVSKMLGHRNIQTTQIYAHVTDAEKNQAANAIVIDLKEDML